MFFKKKMVGIGFEFLQRWLASYYKTEPHIVSYLEQYCASIFAAYSKQMWYSVNKNTLDVKSCMAKKKLLQGD